MCDYVIEFKWLNYVITYAYNVGYVVTEPSKIHYITDPEFITGMFVN